jgi:hypothetical protein
MLLPAFALDVLLDWMNWERSEMETWAWSVLPVAAP